MSSPSTSKRELDRSDDELPGGGFRRLRPPQHGAQGRVAQRLARNSVASDCFHDLGRVVLLAPQLLDQPFGLASHGRGLAPGLVARLQGRGIPQEDRVVPGAGRQRRAVRAEGERPDEARVPKAARTTSSPRARVPQLQTASGVALARTWPYARQAQGERRRRTQLRCGRAAPGTRRYQSAIVARYDLRCTWRGSGCRD